MLSDEDDSFVGADDFDNEDEGVIGAYGDFSDLPDGDEFDEGIVDEGDDICGDTCDLRCSEERGDI